jgi:ketosteroid isomerase-like protein
MPEGSGAGSVELRAEIARMRDRQQIVELHDQYAAVLDAADYDALAPLFTDDAVVEGFPGSPVTGAATIARWLGDISTHHLVSQRMITNHRIALAGDRARVVAAFRSAHLDRADDDSDYLAHTHEGWYLSDVARVSDGWRFARLTRVNLTDALSDVMSGGTAVCEEVYRYVATPPSDRTTSRHVRRRGGP